MDIFFTIVTAFIAWHGLTFKDSEGKKDYYSRKSKPFRSSKRRVNVAKKNTANP